MEESTAKEKVLKHVREALLSKTDPPFPRLDYDKPVFREMEEPADINFAQELAAAGGHFIYCADHREFIEGLKYLSAKEQWGSVFALEPAIVALLTSGQVPVISDHGQLTQARAGITGCESLVARLGSVVVSTGQLAGRQIFVFPEVHIILAYTSQLVNDLRDAILRLRKKYAAQMPSMITLVTGPSRTADIEKTLVIGAHGPKALYVFLVEDRE